MVFKVHDGVRGNSELKCVRGSVGALVGVTGRGHW